MAYKEAFAATLHFVSQDINGKTGTWRGWTSLSFPYLTLRIIIIYKRLAKWANYWINYKSPISLPRIFKLRLMLILVRSLNYNQVHVFNYPSLVSVLWSNIWAYPTNHNNHFLKVSSIWNICIYFFNIIVKSLGNKETVWWHTSVPYMQNKYFQHGTYLCWHATNFVDMQHNCQHAKLLW